MLNYVINEDQQDVQRTLSKKKKKPHMILATALRFKEEENRKFFGYI